MLGKTNCHAFKATPQGTELGTLKEETLIKIKENGEPVEFYVAKQGYEPDLNGPDRVLMVRKDVYDQRAWNSTNVNPWATSTILEQLTRSPNTENDKRGITLRETGILSDSSSNNPGGSRPYFTLPSTALVDNDLNLIESTEPAPSETPLSDLAGGTLITIQESGVPVEFYIAKQNYEEGLNGSGRVLCVRKDVQSNQVWDAGDVNAYAESDIDTWFNSTYKSTLSSAVQTMIGTTQFYYTPGNGTNVVAVLNRAIFALSLAELDESDTYANAEGSTLPISNILKIAYLDGKAESQWVRTPVTNYNYLAWGILSTGTIRNANCYGVRGARPCFTLPSTAYVDSNLALIETA